MQGTCNELLKSCQNHKFSFQTFFLWNRKLTALPENIPLGSEVSLHSLVDGNRQKI